MIPHINEINAFFDDNFFHVISICETWLHSGIHDSLISRKDYYIIRNDREGKRGGGVACYVHCSLKAKLLDASPSMYSESPEFLLIELSQACGGKLLFVSMYRPPNTRLFTNFISSYNKIAHAYNNIIIAGDLNCNLLTDNTYSRHLRELIFSLSLFHVPSEATYHTSSSHTLLDIIILDSPDKLVKFTKSSTPFINGHDLLDLTYAFNLPQANQAKVISRRCIKNFNEQDFTRALASELKTPTELLSSIQPGIHQVDFLVDLVTDKLNVIFERYAPIRTFSVTKSPKPWITDQIKDRIKEKSRLYKYARRSNSALAYAIYRDFRDQLTVDLRRSKDEYLANRLSSIVDQSRMWKELANLGLVNSNLVSPLHFFTCDELNLYYASITGSDPPLSVEEFNTKVLSLPLTQPVFDFTPIDMNTLDRYLDARLSNSLSSGVDKISSFCLTKSRTVINDHLLEIINLSIVHSHFPSSWGAAVIRPLSKIKTPQSPSDTRPVSNLPEKSKIAERVLYDQIYNFAESNNILDVRQSGFRSLFSTQTALLRVTDDIRLGIEHQKLTILILFDFSKAFDMVPHLRLLMKLRALGFSDSSLTLLFSYLSGRSHAVVDDQGNCSNWLPITRGVPQGSVLGPLLFSLYIKDIGEHLRYSDHMIFADDTQIYLQCYRYEINQALAKISYDAQIIADFANSNGLSLNVSKSKALILGSQAYVQEINVSSLQPISINNNILPYDNNVRNLGMQFSADMSWKKHISLISQKVNFTLYKLKFHKNSLSSQLRIKLINALVFPHLDYCCLVYHDITDELNSKLQVLANNCIRFIFDLRRDEHVSPYRRQLGWLTVKQRRLYFLGIMAFKVIRFEVPSYISELLPRDEGLLRRSSRLRSSNSTFIIPNHRTSAYHKSFRLSVAYLWNSLPQQVTSSTSLQVFKTKLYLHLFHSPTDIY